MTNLEQQAGEVAGTDETQQADTLTDCGTDAPAAEAATGGEVAAANAGADAEPDPNVNDVQSQYETNKAAIEAEASLHAAHARSKQPQISVGRFVQYRLTREDAGRVNGRRGANVHESDWPRGAVAHFGNSANENDVLPMLVVRTWGGDMVNGQVFLDGNDTFWVTSVHQSEPGELRAGNWQWPTLS